MKLLPAFLAFSFLLIFSCSVFSKYFYSTLSDWTHITGKGVSSQIKRFADLDRIPVGAVLQGLDKVTARISEFTVPAGQSVHFGSLHITVRDCFKRPPEETPESAAFLEISDRGIPEKPVRFFSGWMFASSPALSALEHPVYDVWVVDCMNISSISFDKSGKKSAVISKADVSN
ncbi:MAG: hypothetical protein CMM44_04255 [Rhodospirillaceae bacterium]|nr:hypothetical protein [Rhodospirillaceae bacterium]